jgi:hypothetical protein
VINVVLDLEKRDAGQRLLAYFHPDPP